MTRWEFERKPEKWREVPGGRHERGRGPAQATPTTTPAAEPRITIAPRSPDWPVEQLALPLPIGSD